jgi:hypothetical protein
MAITPVPSTVGQGYLLQAKLNVQNQLAQMTAFPKPSYSLDGVSYSWGEHFNNLVDKMKELDAAIMREDGPYEVLQLPIGVPGGGSF